MAKRFKMSKKNSRKKFRRGLTVHKKNLRAIPMRGGFRL